MHMRIRRPAKSLARTLLARDSILPLHLEAPVVANPADVLTYKQRQRRKNSP